jgi:hypothetical protein
MNNLYSYLSDEDREILYERSEYEYQFAYYMAALESAEKSYDLACMKVDLQILNENGTDEDMDELYTEAKNQNDPKQEKAKAGILNTISNFISSIFNRLANLFKRGAKDDPTLEVSLPDTPQNIISGINSAFNNVKVIIKSMITKTNSDGEQEVSKIRAILGGLGFAAVVGSGVRLLNKNKKNNKTVKVKLSELTAALPSLNELKENIINFVKGLGSKNENGEKDSKKFEKVKKALDPLFGLITSVGNKIKNAIGSIKTKKNGDDNNTDANEKNTNNETEENTNESNIDDLNGDFEDFYEESESFDVDMDEVLSIIESI